MKSIMTSKNLITITQVFFVLVVLYFLESDIAMPLLALSASGNSGCGNGAGGAGAGGGFGGGGGSAGGGFGGGGSTPFLCVWDGKRYKFENDILFGKPTSRFDSKALGQSVYEKGGVVGDIYKIQNSVVPKGGYLSFQIREIEPEESYVDYLSLVKVAHPTNGTLITSSDFKDFLVFDTTELNEQAGVESAQIISSNNKNLHNQIGNFENTKHEHEMQTGDSFTLKAKVRDIENPLYFVLGSLYRDWAMGEIESLNDISNYAIIRSKFKEVLTESKTVKSFVSGTASLVNLTLVFVAIWVVLGIQSLISLRSLDNTSEPDYLSAAFGVNSALADVPSGGGGGGGGVRPGKSLNIEYLTDNGYQLIDIVQPRYHKRNLDAVLIPPDAISAEGEVTIRVTATKRHNVTNAMLVSPTQLLTAQTEEFKVNKAYNKRTKHDSRDALNSKMSHEYLHTIPGDIVEIEFGPINESSLVTTEGEISTYLVRAHGYYTSLSESSAREAGDWVKNLDSESKEILRGMYSLSDHHKKIAA